MAITVPTSAKSSTVGADSTTTGAFDTTGCDGVLIYEAWYNLGTTPTLSDNQSNSTPTSLTVYNDVTASAKSRISYLVLANKNASHTFTSAGTGAYTALIVLGLAGMHQSSPFDTGTDNTGSQSGATYTFNSETPSENDCIVVCGIGNAVLDSPDVVTPSGYTRPQTVTYLAANNCFSVFAYKIQTTAGAEAPAWTILASAGSTGALAAFKAAAAGGNTTMAPAAYAFSLAGQTPTMTIAVDPRRDGMIWFAKA